MAFLDIRFPIDISYGAEGGPGFLTDIVITQSGTESRDQTRSIELGQWDVSQAAKLPAEYQQLQAFFRIAAGRANTFRFRDEADHTASASEGKFTLLTATTFQCVKRYTFGSSTFDRKIVLPISTITVTGGTGVSVDYSTGVVTVASGTPTAWAGEFDVLARFDTDRMHREAISRSGGQLVITWASIPVVEVRG